MYLSHSPSYCQLLLVFFDTSSWRGNVGTAQSTSIYSPNINDVHHLSSKVRTQINVWQTQQIQSIHRRADKFPVHHQSMTQLKQSEAFANKNTTCRVIIHRMCFFFFFHTLWQMTTTTRTSSIKGERSFPNAVLPQKFTLSDPHCLIKFNNVWNVCTES